MTYVSSTQALENTNKGTSTRKCDAAADQESPATVVSHDQGRRGADTNTESDTAEPRRRLAFALCCDLWMFAASTGATRNKDASVDARFLEPPYLSDTQAERARTCTIADLRGDAAVRDGETRVSLFSKPDADTSKTLVAFLEEGMAALVVARRAKRERGDGAGGSGGGTRDYVPCTSHDPLR